MSGLIADGDMVTLEPYQGTVPTVGEIVLARIEGRRFAHLVLHQILERASGRVLVGNNHGRTDGWISAAEVYGKVIRVESPPSAEQPAT